jgi:hypothetical protein
VGQSTQEQQAVEEYMLHDPPGIRGPDESVHAVPFDEQSEILLEPPALLLAQIAPENVASGLLEI